MAGIPYEIEDDSYYLFTCAELKARENEFIGQSRTERMVSAANMEEFLKVLGETLYASEAGNIDKRKSFEQVMISDYGKIILYLDERLRDEHKKLIYILFFEEFLHNAKLLLKSVLLERELEKLYVPLKYGYGALMEAYKSRKYEDIDEPLPAIIEHIRALADEPGEKDARRLEISLESFFTARILETAYSLGRTMMADYIRYKIDLLNIEAIFRNKQLKESRSLTGLLHQGGSLGLKFLNSLEGESMDYIVKQLENTDYADVVIRGGQRLFSDKSFSSFERNRELYFLDYFDSIKYSVSNLEKIFHFFLKKKIELININIIYTGIKFNANRSNLRCRVD